MSRSIPLIVLLICFILPLKVFGHYWSVAGKISCFAPSSPVIRSTYGNAFPDFQLEVARSILCDWEIWANLDYYTKEGHLPHKMGSTRLHVIPLSLGIKYYMLIRRNLFWYVGAGGSYTCAKIRNHSECLKNDLTKWAFGAVFKTGIKYYWNYNLYFEVFLDYFYQHMHLHDSDRDHRSSCFSSASSGSFVIGRDTLNVGGTKIGAGVGWTF